MAGNDDWRLDMSGGAIFEQIAAAVRQMLARGVLQPTDKLPSARELATVLHVNPNTIAHAYQHLERQGVVEIRRGLGTFVREDAPVDDMMQAMLHQAAAEYAEVSRRLGVAIEEAIKQLEEAWHAG